MEYIELDDITVQCKQTGSGHAIWDRNKFQAKSSRPLTQDEVRYIQTEMGYSPYGYGCFYMEAYAPTKPGPDGMYTTEWTCSGSCD